ncbi:hypothetical protein RHGRI_011397 [Rhododendron griersonianum]|uniref:Ribosomal RNA-processing protein 42 n=1 Tax=Rhododendron griersonianum TaxID=479676 RepID=A0AAV6KLR9_9ERIC|nr:hypothetical protein RHGRI_011397 [Rhododendron griersonianum]
MFETLEPLDAEITRCVRAGNITKHQGNNLNSSSSSSSSLPPPPTAASTPTHHRLDPRSKSLIVVKVRVCSADLGNLLLASGPCNRSQIRVDDATDLFTNALFLKAISFMDSVSSIILLCLQSVFQGISIGVAATHARVWRALNLDHHRSQGMVGLSIGEKHFIQGGIAQDLRSDGRKRLTYRPISMETGNIPQANGSARLKMGATDVIASVKAELGKPSPFQPDKSKSIDLGLGLGFGLKSTQPAIAAAFHRRRSTANGSARVKMGATDVIASVKAELGKPSPFQPDKGKVSIYVDCSPTAAPMFKVTF